MRFCIHAHGGPEVMRWEDVPTPEPGPGEALVRHTAIGLNYIDVYFRSGLYKVAALPATLGMEAAGVIQALGRATEGWSVGDRVAYATGPIGAYATARTIMADRLVKIPDSITDDTAAAMMLQGMTAQYLLHRTYRVKPGDHVVVHAAAGGVGLILCQWATSLGATVIGVVSTEAKAQLARENGAAHVVVGCDHLVSTTRKLTAGKMVPVVYDSVGRDTFMTSLDCLAPLGLMVSYGNASGAVPPLDLGVLSAKGSLFLTRPTLATYTASTADLRQTAADLFKVVADGTVKIDIRQRFPLRDAAAAHEALESRRTAGSTILIP